MLFRRKPNLDEVSVAAPCPTSWESMEGDDRIRYCSLCSLNVYNLSGMTRKEGETLMKSATGPMCIRLYRRQDGTLITKDCPVGRRIADACKRRLRAIAMALFACIQAAPALSQGCKDRLRGITTDTKSPIVEGGKDNTVERRSTMGWVFTPNKWRKEESPLPRGSAASQELFATPTLASVPTSSSSKADRSALDAFNDAQRAESTGFTSRASIRYQFAIYQFVRNKNAYDPVFKRQVATAYAKFLKKQNQPEQAKAVLEEFCKR